MDKENRMKIRNIFSSKRIWGSVFLLAGFVMEVNIYFKAMVTQLTFSEARSVADYLIYIGGVLLFGHAIQQYFINKNGN